jgi:hypothetical protein
MSEKDLIKLIEEGLICSCAWANKETCKECKNKLIKE